MSDRDYASRRSIAVDEVRQNGNSNQYQGNRWEGDSIKQSQTARDNSKLHQIGYQPQALSHRPEVPSDTTMSPRSDIVKNIYILRNGDVFESGRKVVYNRRQLRTWDAFLEELTGLMKPRTGAIRELRTPTSGSQVIGFDELNNYGNYVAVPRGEKLRMIDYSNMGSEQDPMIKRRRNFVNSGAHSESIPVTHSRLQVSGRIKYEMLKRGKTIYVYRNGDEYTRAICILLRTLEQRDMYMILRAVEERIILPNNKPVLKLHHMDGRRVLDPDDLEEGHYYVAAGPETFIPKAYGQQLPNLVVGRVDRRAFERMKYLNHMPTPPEGKRREPLAKKASHQSDTAVFRENAAHKQLEKNGMHSKQDRTQSLVPEKVMNGDRNGGYNPNKEPEHQTWSSSKNKLTQKQYDS